MFPSLNPKPGDRLAILGISLVHPEVQAVVLLRQFDESRGHDDVPDPYYGGEDGFTEMIGMIEATMDGLVAHVRTELAKRGGARGA